MMDWGVWRMKSPLSRLPVSWAPGEVGMTEAGEWRELYRVSRKNRAEWGMRLGKEAGGALQ